MSTMLTMIYAEGFSFIGERILPPLGVSKPSVSVLKKAVRVETINAMSQQGIVPITTMKEIGDLELMNNYPFVIVDPKSQYYRDYIKLTTGIEIPDMKVSH